MAKSDQQPRTRTFLPARLTRISWHDLLIVALPTLLVVAGIFLAFMGLVQPAPPKTLYMAAGAEGSSFRRYADQYKSILARNGIDLKVMPSGGSVENLKRLSDPQGNVDVAFVQGGLSADLRSGDLVSLGSMFYEPLFILYWSAHPIERLSELSGRRVAVGPEGSGAEALALALLNGNGIERGGATRLLALDDAQAVDDILAHRIDAVFLAGDSARPDQIRKLVHTRDLRLFNFTQADGYLRRFRYLSRMDLPMGVIDLGQNMPPHPITLVGPTVELVARSKLHPALTDLLIEAAKEVHGHGSVLQNAGEFPSPVERDFPISGEASRYYKSGKSFAYKYMPFWLASLVNRTIVMLVPLLVLVPALRVIPALYGWRVRNRIFRPYAQLMALERETQRSQEPEQVGHMMHRLDLIEASVIDLKLPARYADELYILRQHIDFVRNRLTAMTHTG